MGIGKLMMVNGPPAKVRRYLTARNPLPSVFEAKNSVGVIDDVIQFLGTLTDGYKP